MTTTPTVAPTFLLSARDTAKSLSISERTLWAITAPRGPLPVVKIGRSVRYHVRDIEAFIEAKKNGGVQ
jgi:predicted DNA-binding transcriptional regulator AlpA